jgi:hypothetical protein
MAKLARYSDGDLNMLFHIYVNSFEAFPKKVKITELVKFGQEQCSMEHLTRQIIHSCVALYQEIDKYNQRIQNGLFIDETTMAEYDTVNWVDIVNSGKDQKEIFLRFEKERKRVVIQNGKLWRENTTLKKQIMELKATITDMDKNQEIYRETNNKRINEMRENISEFVGKLKKARKENNILKEYLNDGVAERILKERGQIEEVTNVVSEKCVKDMSFIEGSELISIKEMAKAFEIKENSVISKEYNEINVWNKRFDDLFS